MKPNSVAIVTGASQGIGRSTAIRLAKDFSAVVLVARNSDALTEVEDAVRKAGAEPLSVALDLSRVESPETVVKTALGHYGRIDALLNIAGAVPQICRHGVEASRSPPPYDPGLGCPPRKQGISCLHVGQRSARPQARLCCGRGNKRSHHRDGESVCGTRHQNWGAGEQYRTRRGDDGKTQILSGEMGSIAKHKRRRSHQEVS